MSNTTSLPPPPQAPQSEKDSSPHNSAQKQHEKLQIIFVHLDLGIGGAEQLILHLASSSLEAGHDVQLVTANCRQDHCFNVVKRPHGKLSNNVHVWGSFLPPAAWMGMTALCSTIRLAWLSFWATKVFPDADLVVLDVLPTSIPLLLPHTSVLFYCHFPDKLLTRDTVNGEAIHVTRRSTEVTNDDGQAQESLSYSTSVYDYLKCSYRNLLDSVEEGTMGLADLLVVNSNFTKTQIQNAFPKLEGVPMRVLYPSIDIEETNANRTSNAKTSTSPIVSLNRYERKKNIELLLEAYALLLQKEQSSLQQAQSLPPLIVAGGYDVANVENVEYMGELQALVRQLQITDKVTFLKSISDDVRQDLLKQALCVVYTPHLEHFGIVPCESMAVGTPVLAVKSGGPMETVVDGVTGFLCERTPEAFFTALQKLVQDPQLATKLGRAGRAHVAERFSQDRFKQEWAVLVEEAVDKGRKRRRRHPTTTSPYAMYTRVAVYVMEAVVALVCVLLLTYCLRAVGLLEANAHVVGSVKRALLQRGDEL